MVVSMLLTATRLAPLGRPGQYQIEGWWHGTSTYPTLSADTDREAEAVQLEIYRRMPASRKIRLVFEAIEMSRALAAAGLRTRHPQAGPVEIRRRLLDLTLGEELARRVYGPREDSR